MKTPWLQSCNKKTHLSKKNRVHPVIPSGGLDGTEVKDFLYPTESSDSGGLTFHPLGVCTAGLLGKGPGESRFGLFLPFTATGGCDSPSARRAGARPGRPPVSRTCRDQPGDCPAPGGGAPARSGLRRRERRRGAEGARPRPRPAAGYAPPARRGLNPEPPLRARIRIR